MKFFVVLCYMVALALPMLFHVPYMVAHLSFGSAVIKINDTAPSLYNEESLSDFTTPAFAILVAVIGSVFGSVTMIYGCCFCERCCCERPSNEFRAYFAILEFCSSYGICGRIG